LNENPAPIPAGRPRKTSEVVARSPACRPLRDLYRWAVDANVASWNQVEERFLEAMSEFDTTLAATATAPNPDALDNLVGDLQNGKGDFFNDLLALLLEGCSGIEDLYARASVPGLLVEVHNLDGVYPSTGEIGFLLEAKMMGTPKHALNRKQKDPKGRRGSADIGKRVKELAFKSIDLKGEASRRKTIRGERPVGGGAGGGDTAEGRVQVPRPIRLFTHARSAGHPCCAFDWVVADCHAKRREHHRSRALWLGGRHRPVTQPVGPDRSQRDRRRPQTRTGLAEETECRRRTTSVSRVRENRTHGSTGGTAARNTYREAYVERVFLVIDPRG